MVANTDAPPDVGPTLAVISSSVMYRWGDPEGAVGRPPPGLLGHEDGDGGKLAAIARACADRVVVPPDAAAAPSPGNRGFLFPELTRPRRASRPPRPGPRGRRVLVLEPDVRDRHDASDRKRLPLLRLPRGAGHPAAGAGIIEK